MQMSPFLSFFLLAVTAPGALSLWPNPNKITQGLGYTRLSPAFTISTSSISPPADLANAIKSAKSRITSDNHSPLVVDRGASIASKVNASPILTSLVLSPASHVTNFASIASLTTQPVEKWDESYDLTIPGNGGSAQLVANTTIGLYRGLETFTQLVYTLPGGTTRYLANTTTIIKDRPAFPYRGFLLDTSRNFYPVADILRTLDAMSWTKLNVFHWHIVDSQSWPLPVAAFPELQAKAAYSAAELYSPSDMQTILNYAAERGITTMVEIDLPGHTDSIAASHPEYVACSGWAPWSADANEPPAGQLRFMDPKVKTFVNQLLKSVLPTLPGHYFSTGGDELNLPCYNDSTSQALLKQQKTTLEGALTPFVLSTHDTVRSAGKTPSVWEEMAISHDVGNSLGNDTLVITWISSDDVTAVVNKGLRVIHTPSDYFYLDCGGGGWVGACPSCNSWCEPYKTWQNIYSFDPFAGTTAATQHLIFGGQTALWSEQSGPENMDPVIWPRAASAAEVFWTGAKQPNGAARDPAEALPRLHDWRYRTVARGVNAIQLQPQWCALRPQACNLNS